MFHQFSWEQGEEISLAILSQVLQQLQLLLVAALLESLVYGRDASHRRHRTVH